MKLNRENVTLQVSEPVEEWVPGEFELPEYLHHSMNDSQVTQHTAQSSYILETSELLL